MLTFKKSIAVFLMLLAATIPAMGQELLTLDKAVGLALEQNRMLRAATHDLESARWGKLNSITNYLPKVDIGSSLVRIDPESERMANAALDFIKASAGALGVPSSALKDMRPFAYRDTYATTVTVVQPIYNGGAEIVGINAASAMYDRSEYSRDDTEQDVIARARTSYYTVLKAEEMATLAKEAADRSRKYLEMTTRRAEAGMRTHTDVLRWEVQLASGENAVINAENMVAMARLQLNEVLGADLTTQYTLEKIAENDSSLSLAQPSSLLAFEGQDQDLGTSFLDSHPTMKIMEANLRLADVNIQKSWINFQPKVNLAFQYGWEKNNTLKLDGIRPWAISLGVSFPIFNGFGDFTNMERAREEYKRTEAQVESARRGLVMQATNARLSLRSAQKRIEIARKAQQEALEVLNSVSRRHDAGGASNVDLIDVQTAYTSARADFINSVYDYYIAEVQLARALGNVGR